eukprot:9468717-Pyramimonas_sp.AAC.1
MAIPPRPAAPRTENIPVAGTNRGRGERIYLKGEWRHYCGLLLLALPVVVGHDLDELVEVNLAGPVLVHLVEYLLHRLRGGGR